MFLLRQPTSADIDVFLQASRDCPFSYAPIGLARESRSGFSSDRARVVLGNGQSVFDRASDALRSWKHFDLGWVRALPAHAPIEVGTIVAVQIRHFGFWSLNGARIAYLVEEDGTWGFAYGTLATHAECGEELFLLRREPNGDVVYELHAASRPRAAITYPGYPLVRMLQAKFRRDSCAAMVRAVQRSR
jgi:uncharacterized protein (UPF0548 family)